MPIHEDQKTAVRQGLQAFNTAVVLGLTDPLINPITTTKSSTVPPLVTAYTTVVSGLKVHEDQQGALRRINKAAIAMEALGVYTDPLLTGADTATEHRVEIFQLADPTLAVPASNLLQQGTVLHGE